MVPKESLYFLVSYFSSPNESKVNEHYFAVLKSPDQGVNSNTSFQRQDTNSDFLIVPVSGGWRLLLREYMRASLMVRGRSCEKELCLMEVEGNWGFNPPPFRHEQLSLAVYLPKWR